MVSPNTATDQRRGWCRSPGVRNLRRLRAGVYLACFVGPACVALPAPPETPDLATLGPRYDSPTARLPARQTAALMVEVAPYLDVASRLDGLGLIRTAVGDTSKALDEALTTDSLTVQGTINAQLICPGHGSTPVDTASKNGTLDVTMGVSETHIQRALSGSAKDCRFVSGRAGLSDWITLSTRFVADLGKDVAIGDPPPPTLTVQLTELDLRGIQTGLMLPKLQANYNFRVTQDDSIEVLVDLEDLEDLGLPELDGTGTLVLITHADGSIGLREQRGEWTCPKDGGECSLSER